jgi:glycogen synthase
MRLLKLTYYPPMFGGAVGHAKELAEAMARRGHEICVVTVTESADGDGGGAVEPDGEGIEVVRVPNYAFVPNDYTARFHQQNIRALEGVLRAEVANGAAFDAVVLHGYFFAPAALAATAAYGCPFIFHVHNMYSAPTPLERDAERAYFRALEAWALASADVIIPVSDYIGGMCIELGADPARMKVIPKALHMNEYEGEWAPQDDRTILFAGRLSPEKGLETLFASVRLLVDRGGDVRLLLAGSGEPDYVSSLRSLLAELDLRRHVALLGVLRGADLIRLYQRASVTAVPSYMEAFGRTAIEAMAAGCPVVVTDVGGLGPLVADGATGWKVPAHDASALADALGEALADPAEAGGRAERASRYVRQTFDWDHVLDETLSAYELAFAHA